MADCAGCGRSIQYGRYWLSFLKNIFRNMWRSQLSPIVTCGHCGQDNVQPTPYVLFQFVAIVALVLAVVLIVGPAADADWKTVTLIVLAIYFPLEFVWWTFVTRLKKLGH